LEPEKEIHNLTIFEAIILGLVQGLAEFLPISSSGHLALLQHFFGIEEGDALTFAIMLHVGTLISVFVVYWRDLVGLIAELGMVFKDIFTGKGPRIDANPTRKLGFLIIVATIPTGIIGILLRDVFEMMYGSLVFLGIGFLITGTILFIADRVGSNQDGIKEMKFRSAAFVGICQGFAIWPGISRSGATIFSSLACGLTRESAVKFVFLISIPAILGATLLDVREGIDAMSMSVVVGMAVSAVSGIFAIKTMIKVISNKKLFGFSLYTWALGILVILYSVFERVFI